LQFEINGQDYFLNFVPDEGRWFLFKPTRLGVAAIPVVEDDGPGLFSDDSTPPDTGTIN
jgi:hypothetical protein